MNNHSCRTLHKQSDSVCSAEQPPLTGYEPKGFMTAGGNTASTEWRRSSTTTERNHTRTPSAGQDWQRGDMCLASQLLSKNCEASGDGLVFWHSSRADSSHPCDSARGNSMQGKLLHGSHERKSRGEQNKFAGTKSHSGKRKSISTKRERERKITSTLNSAASSSLKIWSWSCLEHS